ncbi:MAG: hypothetical protein IKS41_03140 [Alphaproteobacteria bacterium]|nr:hypothetical protein [Alphaproteobacteria bacterium]
MKQVDFDGSLHGFLFLFLFWTVLFFVILGWKLLYKKWKPIYKKLKKGCEKSFEEQSLENEIKLANTPEDLIYLYEKSKSYQEREFYYDILVQIVSALIKLKAFPEGVVLWLDPPDEYTKEDLHGVMEEFIAFRSGNLKDVIAVEAYCDGFISAEQALAYTDKELYPKTVALLTSDPEDYDGIREMVEGESEELEELT